jgi:hypothetical protein
LVRAIFWYTTPKTQDYIQTNIFFKFFFQFFFKSKYKRTLLSCFFYTLVHLFLFIFFLNILHPLSTQPQPTTNLPTTTTSTLTHTHTTSTSSRTSRTPKVHDDQGSASATSDPVA